MAERYIGRVSEVLKEVRVKGYEELWEVLSVFWVDYMVYRRQRVLGGRTPFEVLMEKWRERPDIFWVDCRDHFRVLFNNLSRLDTYLGPHPITKKSQSLRIYFVILVLLPQGFVKMPALPRVYYGHF